MLRPLLDPELAVPESYPFSYVSALPSTSHMSTKVEVEHCTPLVLTDYFEFGNGDSHNWSTADPQNTEGHCSSVNPLGPGLDCEAPIARQRFATFLNSLDYRVEMLRQLPINCSAPFPARRDSDLLLAARQELSLRGPVILGAKESHPPSAFSSPQPLSKCRVMAVRAFIRLVHP